ncbi:MAG TPA: ABC transporter ATP-binding protein [Streptosporangiaceae bacterium]
MTATAAEDLAELRRPVRGRVTVAAGAQVLATALGVVPLVAVVELGRRLLGGQTSGLWAIAWLAVGAFAARLVLYTLAGGISHLADADLARTLRRRLVRALAELPLGWFAGGVAARVKTTVEDDVAALHHAVAHAPGDMGAAIAGPVVAGAYLLYVDWRLALLTGAAIGAAQATRMRMVRRSAEPAGRIAAARAELSASAIELVRGIAVVKAFGGTRAAERPDATDERPDAPPERPDAPPERADAPPERADAAAERVGAAPARFAAAAERYADVNDEAQRIFIRQRSLARATVAPATILLLVTGAGTWFAALGWTRPLDVVAFLLLGLGLFEQITPIYTARDQRRRARDAAHRISELLREPPEATAAHPVALPAPAGRALPLELDDVRFGYAGGHEVLHGISAELAPGTVTALVGPSGAGKSTLGLLLARFSDPTGGAIRLGGVDVRDVDRAELYRHIGFLFQDVVLLRQSVRDNIALADPDAGDARVEEVAAAAAIDARIRDLPRGYATVLGEEAELSGGEAQRVSIARTLLADTPILVLDEATAFADPESEAAVQDALAALAGGRTLLVIAHRLPTIAHADQILVLDEGRVAERGRHDDLLAAGGLYARLWHAQQEAAA